MSSLRFVQIFFAFLVSGLSFLAFGQEAPSGAAPLRVGVSPVYPPMVFKQGGQLAGVEVDLARAFGQHLGRKVEFVEVPWPEQIPALKKKKIDLFISDSTLVWYLAGMHAHEGLAAVPIALSKEPVAWGVRKGNQPLLNAANEFLQTASQDGTFNQVAGRWMALPR